MLRFKHYSVLLVLAIVCISMIISCSSPEERAVKEAIKRYNDALRNVYIKSDLSLLEDIATREQITKVMHILQALSDKNSIMISEQKRLHIKSVKIKGDTAEVETEEKWVWWLQDKDSKKIIKSPEDIHYRLVYSFTKSEGKWKVAQTQEIKQ